MTDLNTNLKNNLIKVITDTKAYAKNLLPEVASKHITNDEFIDKVIKKQSELTSNAIEQYVVSYVKFYVDPKIQSILTQASTQIITTK